MRIVVQVSYGPQNGRINGREAFHRRYCLQMTLEQAFWASVSTRREAFIIPLGRWGSGSPHRRGRDGSIISLFGSKLWLKRVAVTRKGWEYVKISWVVVNCNEQTRSEFIVPTRCSVCTDCIFIYRRTPPSSDLAPMPLEYPSSMRVSANRRQQVRNIPQLAAYWI